MATTDEALREAHGALRSEPGYQFELPVADLPEVKPDPEQGAGALDSVFRGLFNLFTALGPILQFLLIVAAVLLVLYVLWSIYQGIQSRQKRLAARDRQSDDADLMKNVEVRPDEEFAAGLLARADQLAAEGQYAEALRILLRQSFSELQSRIKQKIGVSFTAREIGQLGAMPDISRTAFHNLIHQVEISAFGQQSVGKAEYDFAREQYQVFAFGETRS